MKFCIVQITAKAVGGITYLIHDAVRMLLYSLESLGHDVIFQEDRFAKDRINILVTAFRMSEQQVKAVQRSNVPYIVYQTEIFSDDGLNDQSTGMIYMQNIYMQLLRGALAVWECFDFNQSYLKEQDIQSTILSHGYVPQLEGKSKKNGLYDVCFFGSPTAYRAEIISKLAKLNVRLNITGKSPALVRDEILRVSKINISLLANDTSMTHLPHFRVLTGLYHNTMTISESARTQEWVEPLVKMVDGGVDDFVDTIMEVLETESYTALAKEYKERFVAMPMTDIMREMLVGL